MFKNKKIHMLGIGGISMSGIAYILKSFDNSITGYDAQESDITKRLNADGIKTVYEENYSLIDEADIIVYTAAIGEDNKAFAYAKTNNKEMYERSTFLGLLMKEYKNVLCISGTHGKSTTTGMVSTLFLKANLNPTIQIGAMLPLINGNYHVGDKDYFIAESCEYVDSFLEFNPTRCVILDIDNDHLDYFKNLDNIKKSFNTFAHKVTSDNLVVNADDANTLDATKDINGKITYGINNSANYMAKNIIFDNDGHPTYDLYINDKKEEVISLNVTGIHNVYDSLAAIALSHKYINDLSIIKEALYSYHGIGRRFELLGTYNGASIYDDYAHHPSEIETTYKSVESTKHNHVYAIFQSHTFSRTVDHLDDFGKVLSKFENVIIAPIYPAREENIYNIHEEDIVRKIKENGNENVTYIDSFDKIKEEIKKKAKDGDLIITIGAGPVNKISSSLAKGE